MLWLGVLVFGSVISLVAYVDSGRNTAKTMKSRLQETWETRAEAELMRGVGQPLLKRIQPFIRRLMPAQAVEDARRRLMYADYPKGLTPEEFFSLKVIGAAVGYGLTASVLAVGLGWRALSLAFAGAAIAYLTPDMWLNSVVTRRKREIERQLLSFVDMLALSVEAGLSLMDAMQRVAEYYGGVLGAEFGRLLKELQMGKPLVKAFEDMAERNGVEDLNLLLSALEQASRHGTPLTRVLKEQAVHLRQLRRTRAQEIAQKAGVKILFPVIVFMFIPMMVLLLGPAVMNLGRALGL